MLGGGGKGGLLKLNVPLEIFLIYNVLWCMESCNMP